MNDPVVRFLVVNTAVSLALALGALACSWVRLRPQIVHLLWLAALVKLITPSVVPVPVWPAPPAEAAAGPSIDFLEVVPLVSGGAPSTAGVPPVVPSPVLGPADGPSVSQHPSPSASSRPWRPLGPLRPLRPWLLILWAAGSAAWAGLAIGRMARFHRLLRHAELMNGTSPRVCMVEAPISPLLWAFLGRARIVVPKALFGALSEPEREAILRHERAHFRRRDHWVRWVEFAVLAVLWWHPLAWWISRRLRAAEEACCDAEVVADMPDRRPYASALLRTALFISEAAPLPRAATGIGRAASIHHRVQSLMTTPACPRLSFGASCALLVLTSFVVLAAPVEKPAPPPDTKSSKAPPAQTPDSSTPTAPDAIPEATAPAPTDSPPAPESPLWAPPPKEPARPFSLGGEDLDLPGRDTIEGQYLSGYMKVQQAEGRQKAGDPEGARRLYRSALAIFENVRARAPEWQPSMVEYRLNLVRRQLALPSSLPVAAGTVVTQLTVKPNQSSRYAIKGSLLEQPWALVADRVEVVHAPSKSPRWSTVVGSGSIRGGWGSWRLTADTLDIDGSTTTLTGNPVLIVDTQFDPPQVILKGNRAVINTKSELLTLTGSAMAIHPTMEWRTRESDGFIQLSLPGGRNHEARMSAGTQTMRGSTADRQRAAAELLKTWPGHQTLEEELAPLLQRAEKPDSPVDQWLPEVDGPRQEPLPKEGTPPKKLPG